MKTLVLMLTAYLFLGFSECGPVHAPTSHPKQSEETLFENGAIANESADQVDVAGVGDVNGDGYKESFWLTTPDLPEEITEENFGDCGGTCFCTIHFSDKHISPIQVEGCIDGVPEILGDLNGDGTDEIGILPSWWIGCWQSYLVFTYRRGRWKYAVEPLSVYICNDEYEKPIEKDPESPGRVIIRDLDEEGTLRTSSIILSR